MFDAFIEVFTTFGGIFSLFTLVVLEIVLGIDNIIFIAILVGRLPTAVREQTRRLGIAIAHDGLGTGIRTGNDFFALAVGVSAQFLAFGGTQGT